MSSTTLLLIHKIAVTAFFVHYLVKAILLLFAKKETLEKYSRPTKPLEMLLALAFLATGVWLLTMKGQVSKMLIIKLVLVFSSIPIGVIAFKKGKRALAVMMIVFLTGAYGLAEMNSKYIEKKDIEMTEGDATANGKKVYDAYCKLCHGDDGTKNFGGASDLSLSEMTFEEQKEIILNGKGDMQAFKNTLEEGQLEAVIEHINTLRTVSDDK